MAKTTCNKCRMEFHLGLPKGAKGNRARMYGECATPGCHRRFGEVKRDNAKFEMYVERRRMVR